MATLFKSAVREAIRPALFKGAKVDAASPMDEDPLATLTQEMRRDLSADGVLVTWHENGRAPAVLFTTGICQTQSAIERDMLIAATDAAGVRCDQAAVCWAPEGEVATAGLLTACIAAPHGVVTVTSVFRRIGKAARRQVRETAMRSLPMVQAFFRLWASRAQAVAASRGLAAALDSSDVATILIHSDGRVGFINRAAERILAQNNGLRRANGVLSGSRLADTMRLQAAIEHVIHGAPAGVASVPVVALHRKDLRPLLAAIVPADRAEADATAAIVRVFDPDQEIDAMVDPVCRLYGLTAVEGRLATLLAGGAVLADAAAAMGIQEQTARSYLKQIFLKTDTNRQAELVWLLLKSGVRTAPGCRTSFF